MLISIDPSMLSSSSIVHVQGCSAPQIFSKQQMSPFELSSCCSCHVFSYNFAQFLLLKRVTCPPFFVFTTKTTQPHPQVFSVNGALTVKQSDKSIDEVFISEDNSDRLETPLVFNFKTKSKHSCLLSRLKNQIPFVSSEDALIATMLLFQSHSYFPAGCNDLASITLITAEDL